jgi:hypothetical protein
MGMTYRLFRLAATVLPVSAARSTLALRAKRQLAEALLPRLESRRQADRKNHRTRVRLKPFIESIHYSRQQS